MAPPLSLGDLLRLGSVVEEEEEEEDEDECLEKVDEEFEER